MRHRMTRLLLVVVLLAPGVLAAASCDGPGVHLQVLGSGGPELDDHRASTGYLVWQDGRGRLLIDLGPGSLRVFEDSGARIEDLDAVLLTHLHVDHSADLPALIKGSFFTDRRRDLPLYGPTGNRLMPATSRFARSLFDAPKGAFRYLVDYLDGSGAYRLAARDVPADARGPVAVYTGEGLKLSAIGVHHGPVAALAWRVELGGRSLVVSGDMNGDWGTLPTLARGADLLVAHHAIPEGMSGVARNLHMPPSVIGAIAAEAGPGRLLLSHRMNRTLGLEAESARHIRRHYQGPLSFAEDGQCVALGAR